MIINKLIIEGRQYNVPLVIETSHVIGKCPCPRCGQLIDTEAHEKSYELHIGPRGGLRVFPLPEADHD